MAGAAREVTMGAVAQAKAQFMLFAVWKKNDSNKYQPRILHVDFRTQQVNNLDQESVQTQFKFNELKMAERDPKNPLGLTLYFKKHHAYELFLHSPSDRNLLCDLCNFITTNESRGLSTEAVSQRNIVKTGGADKEGTIKWDRRWLVLYKYLLFVYRTDTSERPINAISMFNVPIVPEGDKTIRLLGEDRQFSFRFDTKGERDDWFEKLILCSQDDLEVTVAESQRAADITASRAAAAADLDAAQTRRRAMEEEAEKSKAALREVAEATKVVQTLAAQTEFDLQKTRTERDKAEELKNYAQRELAAARDRITAATTERERAEAERVQDERRALDLERDRADAIARATQTRQLAEAAAAQLQTAQSELAAESAKQMTVSAQLQQASESLKVTRDTAQRELDALKQAADEERTIRESLQGESAQWTAEQRKLSEENAQTGDRLKAIRAEVTAALQVQAEFKSEAEQLAAVQSNVVLIQQLTVTRQKQEEEITRLRAAVEAGNKTMEELRAQHASVMEQMRAQQAATAAVTAASSAAPAAEEAPAQTSA